MEYKTVFFGNLPTTQVKCPTCETWQFESAKCDCGTALDGFRDIEDRPEYRAEVVTWRDRIKDSVRKKIYERDEYVCQYCRTYCYDSFLLDPKSITIDHLFPCAAGGSSKEDNLITACRDCNLIKSDEIFTTIEDAREYILAHKHGELHAPLSIRQEEGGHYSDSLPLD